MNNDEERMEKLIAQQLAMGLPMTAKASQGVATFGPANSDSCAEGAPTKHYQLWLRSEGNSWYFHEFQYTDELWSFVRSGGAPGEFFITELAGLSLK